MRAASSPFGGWLLLLGLAAALALAIFAYLGNVAIGGTIGLFGWLPHMAMGPAPAPTRA